MKPFALSSMHNNEDNDDFEPLLTMDPNSNVNHQGRNPRRRRSNNRNPSSFRRPTNYQSTVSSTSSESNDDDEMMTSLLRPSDDQIINESNPLLPITTNNESGSFHEQRQVLSAAALHSMRQRAKHQQRRSQLHQRSKEISKQYPIHHHYITGQDDDTAFTQSPVCADCCVCFQWIRTTETGVREYCGEFYDLIGPGWYCMPWPCWFRIVNRVSLRIQQMNVIVTDSKTKDNVFLPMVRLALQYHAIDAYRVHYRTNNTKKLISSIVQDVVRSTVARLTVEQVFADKTWTQEVHRYLERPMEDFGYELDHVPLVIQLDVDPMVQTSMNEVHANQRRKEACSHKAESIKVQRVQQAQGYAEQSYLEGVGLANARKAIVNGLKATLVENEQHPQEEEKEGLCSNQDIMTLLLVSQYMDTLAGLVGKRRTNIATTTDEKETNRTDSMVVCSDPRQVALLSRQMFATFEKNKTEEQSVLTQEEIDMRLLEKI